MTGQLIYDFIGSLFKIPRSLTGEGVRQTFSKIKSEYLHDLAIHEIPSGKEVGDWTIPKEWNIYAAYIQNQAGEKIINFEENNLHVVGYSVPINRKIALQELNEYIYSLPELPDAIPYVTSYYRETWGFCMADSQRNNLKDEKYHVYIDSVLSTGSLTYADLIIPGHQKEEIFFFASVKLVKTKQEMS